MGKILNLLFDTFHSTKYFHALLYTLACHFTVGYLGYDYATIIFLDFSML
jgi:hypothetical protein